jgi:Mitochondrial carrier protein
VRWLVCVFHFHWFFWVLKICVGTISQTLTYPFDVLRRKMQVTGMKGGAIKYAGAVDALRSILRVEGVAGLYRGLWPNLRESRVCRFDCTGTNDIRVLQSRLRQVLPRHFSHMSW